MTTPWHKGDCRQVAWLTMHAARNTHSAAALAVLLVRHGGTSTEITRALDRAASAAERLSGWPSGDAAHRLVAAVSRCTESGRNDDTELDEAWDGLEAALRFDGFLSAQDTTT